jgi:hypothetical protein
MKFAKRAEFKEENQAKRWFYGAIEDFADADQYAGNSRAIGDQ